MGIYAINAQNGEVCWYYEPETHMTIGGPLVVADHLLYVGTSGTVDHPEKSCFYALDTETGMLRWQHPMDDSYVRAVIHSEGIYVSSRDWHLYALEKHKRLQLVLCPISRRRGYLPGEHRWVWPKYSLRAQ